MADSGIKVLPRHVQQCGFCLAPGARQWVELHNLDWREFIKNGIAVETLEAINDNFARRVAAQARRDANSQEGK